MRSDLPTWQRIPFIWSFPPPARPILDQVTEENRYAVILASRPYQNDPLVNHSLPEMFTSLGIPVLTADAVPGVNDVDLTTAAWMW